MAAFAHPFSANQRTDFYPPRPHGTGRAVVLALFAHLLLLGALTWGVSWKREAAVATVEAELWSALPQQAAPKLQEAPPYAPLAVPEAAPLPAKAPEIVTEKIKPKPEPKPKTKPQPLPEAKAELKPQASNAQEEKKRTESKEAERLKNIERMAGLAGTSGDTSLQGTAMQSSGPSSSYAGLIRGRVRPNLVFPGGVSGNPLVSLEVRLAPDGTVLGRPRIVKSSGNKEWDDAVARAFEKTEVLPRDGGKIWSPLIIDWRLND